MSRVPGVVSRALAVLARACWEIRREVRGTVARGGDIEDKPRAVIRLRQS